MTLLVGFVTTTAHAEAQDDRSIALGLFEQGRKLRADGQNAEAVHKFEAAAKLMRTYGILLNLAECYEKLGRMASAWSTWREAESIARNQQHADDEQRAAQRVHALEPQLSYLTLLVPEAHRLSDLSIVRNDVPVPAAAWSTPLPLDPGPQSIVVRAPGYRDWKAEIVLRDQANQQVVQIPMLSAQSQAELAAPAQPNSVSTQAAVVNGAGAPASSKQPMAHSGIPSWLGPVVGVTGVVTMVVGAVLWKTGQSRIDDARAQANQAIAAENQDLYRDARDQFSSAKSLRTTGIVTSCVGAALGVTGLALTILPRKSSEPSRTGFRRANAWIDGRAGGVSIAGAF